MALPTFGGDAEVGSPQHEVVSLEAVDGDELLPQPEDDVEGQVADFLDQLPSDAHEVVERLLAKDDKHVEPDEDLDARSARVEESCEFLLRLLEFCTSAQQRRQVLEKWLRAHPREGKVRKKILTPSASSDMLELRRMQRLSSNILTPAVALTSQDSKPRCFGRVPEEETGEEVLLVHEAFRGQGRVELRHLETVLTGGELSQSQLQMLLEGAEGVSKGAVVDCEAFLQWLFKT
ncbi:unnamed protein product [Effrenium voratum]|uniref:Uncharacterized protein n=1 Tax=Effrenium voratum TaxID=2562239 RepID=A0AA36HN36_9DINO|nr:unnamed protein product [Effrenium voratum]